MWKLLTNRNIIIRNSPITIEITGDVWQQKGLINWNRPGNKTLSGRGADPVPVSSYNPNQLISPFGGETPWIEHKK